MASFYRLTLTVSTDDARAVSDALDQLGRVGAELALDGASISLQVQRSDRKAS